MYLVESESQLRVLSSPVRQEIVDTLQASRRATVAEIAAELGRPADGLYYHVRQLVSAGLLVESGQRPAGRRVETVYTVRGGGIRVSYRLGRRRFMEGIASAVAAMLRLSERDFRAAVHSPDAVGSGPGRNLWGGRARAWLSPAEMREVRGHLESVHKIMNRAKRSPGDRLHSVAWVLAPLDPGRRATPNEEK